MFGADMLHVGIEPHRKEEKKNNSPPFPSLSHIQRAPWGHFEGRLKRGAGQVSTWPRFMHLTNTSPQQPSSSPLQPAHRGHIHPRVGTVGRLWGEQQAHFNLKEFFSHFDCHGCVEGRRQNTTCAPLHFSVEIRYGRVRFDMMSGELMSPDRRRG